MRSTKMSVDQLYQEVQRLNREIRIFSAVATVDFAAIVVFVLCDPPTVTGQIILKVVIIVLAVSLAMLSRAIGYSQAVCDDLSGKLNEES